MAAGRSCPAPAYCVRAGPRRGSRRADRAPGAPLPGGGAVPPPGRVGRPVRPGWFGQGGAATMAARRRRDLAGRLVRQTNRHGTAFQTWCGARVSCHTDLALGSVEANQRTRQQHEREEPLRVPVPPHCQAPIAAQPRQRPFDLPAVAAEPLRRLDPTPSDPRGDPTTPQPGTVAGAVVGLVRSQLAGSMTPPARRRAHRRDVVDHRLKHGHVREVGGGHRRRQR
jgi:hypothetical protein